MLFTSRPREMDWWAPRELHTQGCLILSQVDLLFSVNHVPENRTLGRNLTRISDVRSVALYGLSYEGNE